MIVNDSKFNGASVFRALDLKILSVMKTPNQIVALYKDIEKLDTQNPVIGSLSTQIESGKLTDKKVDEYLNKIQAIKDLEMAEKVKQLKDLNKKNDDDDDDDDEDDNKTPFGQLLQLSYNFKLPFPPSYYSFLPSISDNDNLEKNLNPTQKFLLGNNEAKPIGELEKIREEIPTTEKVIFSENLNKLFPKGEDDFNNELKSDENKIKITIPNVQTIFKKINEGRIPNELHFFQVVKVTT